MHDQLVLNDGRGAAAGGPDRVIEVFADITCPFTHVGLRRLVAERDARGLAGFRLLVSSWPLELINGESLQGDVIAPKVAALREAVAPDLFAGFDPDHFPTTSLPALALVAAAYAAGTTAGGAAGERLSLALRTALFEDGADIGDPDVLAGIARDCGLGDLAGDDGRVVDDWHRGEALGVLGSPHFIVDGRAFFCPALDISHGPDGLSIAFDQEAFDEFLDAVLA